MTADYDPTALWYALLFSLPVGVGVGAAVMRSTGRAVADPMVALPSVGTAVVLFAFVATLARRRAPAANLDSGRR